MNMYDGLFILRPDLRDEEVKSVTKGISDSIIKGGGSIQKEENWGKKQLAYRMNKVRDGNFYKVDFSAPPAALSKLEAGYKLNADIIRVMITKK